MVVRRFFRAAVVVILTSAIVPLHAETADVISVQRFNFPPTSLQNLGHQPFSNAALQRATRNGLKFTDRPSIGSGLARVSDNQFLGISDRGPNGDVNGRRTFPLPKFCPFIVRFRLGDGEIEPLQYIPLVDSNDKPLTGLSNREGEEWLFATKDSKTPLPFDQRGIDPEAIRLLPNGHFIIAEEYGPSILVVNSRGVVQIRYTPEAKPLRTAAYPVRAILPRILAARRDNRGFESLALSKDGRTAYAILQSPLGDLENPHYKQSRIVRAIRLDLTNPLRAKVTGHFLVPLSPAAQFGPTQEQQNVKFNDADWLAEDRLVAIEAGKSFSQCVIIDFKDATNLLGREDENSLSFESESDLTKLSVKPATTKVWFSTKGLASVSGKLEGLAVLSPNEVAISNDNDFGIGDNDSGEPSTVWLLRLANPPSFTGR